MAFERSVERSSSRWAAPATAVAVALVILAVQQVASGSDDSAVVAPRIPAASGATLDPPCRAADLETRTDGPEDVMGAWHLFVRVRLAAGEPCVLQGYPVVQALASGQRLDVLSAPVRGEGVFRGPVALTADSAAFLSLAWSGPCEDQLRNDTLRLLLPDDGGILTAAGFAGSPGCDDDASGPPRINVRPFSFTPEMLAE